MVAAWRVFQSGSRPTNINAARNATVRATISGRSQERSVNPTLRIPLSDCERRAAEPVVLDHRTKSGYADEVEERGAELQDAPHQQREYNSDDELEAAHPAVLEVFRVRGKEPGATLAMLEKLINDEQTHRRTQPELKRRPYTRINSPPERL